MSTITDEEQETTEETPEQPVQPGTPDEEGEEQPDQHEPPPHEPLPPALSEKDIERMMGKLEKEATAHSNRISAILGEEANDLVRCAMCSPVTPGFYFPQYLDDEVRAAVTEALGMADVPEMIQDPEAKLCEVCNGYGETLTGSKVPGSDTKPCPACASKGWTNASDRNTWESTLGSKAAAAELAPDAPITPAPTSEMPASDAWQRPLGHEFYGLNPVYMTPEQRARDITA